MKKIVFTGGGSAGHVTPNLAIIPQLQANGWDIEYIGSYNGIEKDIIEQAGIPYHGISSGKLRRYFDLKNLKDPFHVLKGVWQAYRLLRKIRPQVVFSKGGFVTVPVIIGSWIHRIPVIIHESDYSPGLANKISTPLASRICVTFPETTRHFDAAKVVYTGSPIRPEILRGDAKKGLIYCGFDRSRPVLLVMGGSLGSEAINRAIRESLKQLLPQFQIVHICGKGHVDQSLIGQRDYRQFEYIHQELPDIFAMADLVVSRAGANSIFEFLALKKPNVLIPLSRQASRGDQILNANSFEKMGYSKVLPEEELTANALLQTIQDTQRRRDEYIANMSSSDVPDAVVVITKLIDELVH